MENKGQIAQIRQRIEEEYMAAQQALYAPAIVARHDFITARMEGMQQAHTELQAILGDEEAIKLVASILDNIQEVGRVQVEPL